MKINKLPPVPGDLISLDGLGSVINFDHETGIWLAQVQMGKFEIVNDLGDWLAKSLQPQVCRSCGAPIERES